MSVETTKLLRKARVLRKHYKLGYYYDFGGALMREMFDRMVDHRADLAEESREHAQVTEELQRYGAILGLSFWTGSRASAAAMAN